MGPQIRGPSDRGNQNQALLNLGSVEERLSGLTDGVICCATYISAQQALGLGSKCVKVSGQSIKL